MSAPIVGNPRTRRRFDAHGRQVPSHGATALRMLGVLLAAVVASAGLAAPAQAATLTVSNLNDSGAGSLRQAIQAANGTAEADTITFAAGLAGGTIRTSSVLLIGGELTIDGDVDDDGTPDITVDAQRNSGVFHLMPAATVTTVRGLAITGGNTASGGGGIFSLGNTLIVQNSEISGNTAAGAGGIYKNVGTLIITNSIISGNSSTRHGGGMVIDSGTVTVTNSTISGNTATESGGGIYYAVGGGTVTVTDSTISGNTATTSGGGIYNHTGTLSVTNSTVSGNSAASTRGGGIYNLTGTLAVTHSTVSGNSANSGGGIATIGGTWIGGSIVVGNTGGDCGKFGGFIISTGSNLEGGTSCGFTTAGSLQDVAVEAVLMTAAGVPVLADHGGPTSTIALLDTDTNPAIDAIVGCAAGADQRGITRPQGDGCDIGAYELIPRATQPVSWTPTSTNLLTSDSPWTPAPLASTTGDGAISYIATDAGTTGCTADTDTGVLTFSAAGSCTITATAAQTSTHKEGTAVVTFTIVEPEPSLVMSAFSTPVDDGWNTVKGGATVPLKFQVFDGDTELTDVAVIDADFTVQSVACEANAAIAAQTVDTTTGATTLRYADGMFIQNWKTPKTPGACYEVSVTIDGASASARFMLK